MLAMDVTCKYKPTKPPTVHFTGNSYSTSCGKVIYYERSGEEFAHMPTPDGFCSYCGKKIAAG